MLTFYVCSGFFEVCKYNNLGKNSQAKTTDDKKLRIEASKEITWDFPCARAGVGQRWRAGDVPPPPPRQAVAVVKEGVGGGFPPAVRGCFGGSGFLPRAPPPSASLTALGPVHPSGRKFSVNTTDELV